MTDGGSPSGTPLRPKVSIDSGCPRRCTGSRGTIGSPDRNGWSRGDDWKRLL